MVSIYVNLLYMFCFFKEIVFQVYYYSVDNFTIFLWTIVSNCKWYKEIASICLFIVVVSHFNVPFICYVYQQYFCYFFDVFSVCLPNLVQHWSHQIRRVLSLPLLGYFWNCLMVVSRIRYTLKAYLTN